MPKVAERRYALMKGLWRIEDAFKVTKNDLETRPVFLSRDDHIRANFLICFVALVIARLLELNLSNKYSITKIKEILNRASGSLLEKDWYVFEYTDEITEAIAKKMGVNLSRKYLKMGKLKK